MWCRDKKKWISFHFSDETTYPKGASSHKHFRTANRAWRHVSLLEKKGIEYQVVRYECVRHKKSGGKRRLLSTVWTSEGYYK